MSSNVCQRFISRTFAWAVGAWRYFSLFSHSLVGEYQLVIARNLYNNSVIASASEPHAQNSKSAATSADLDPQRQRLAKEYAGTRRVLFFASLSLSLVGVGLLLFVGWSISLRQWIESFSTDPWVVVALYGTVLGVLYTAISLPLDFYSGYVLPHKYNLSTQGFGGWALDNVKELALSAAFGLGALELLYWLLRTWPEWWWAIMAGLAWLFMVAMAQLAPVLLMPIFYKIRPLQDSALTERLTALAEQAGTRVRGVYVMDMSSRTTAANAMLTGLGNTRRIILGDTLLEGYTHDEIETVLAHELAHHVHNDLLKGLAAEAILLFAGMWLTSQALVWGVSAFGFRGIADIANLPLLAIVMSLFGLAVMPAGNYMSRQMERAADRYALKVTGKNAAFRSVMQKLAGQNLADANPPAWVSFLFHSHPPMSERIRSAESDQG